MNPPHLIHLIIGTRPNIIKISPLYKALLQETWCTPKLVASGQHTLPEMFQGFLEELSLPMPDYDLKVACNSQGQFTGELIASYEELCLSSHPSLTVVPGDVNTSLACSLAAVKLDIPVAHLESGLRSFDRTMPEEINRVLIDHMATFHWVHSEEALTNLCAEGIAGKNVRHVGNTMIDTLCECRVRFRAEESWRSYGLKRKEYALVTIHRPSNSDDREVLSLLLEKIAALSENMPVVFVLHPRTKQKLKEFSLEGMLSQRDRIKLLEPLNYHTFMALLSEARVMITDSGGVQEEAAYLQVPCLTVRENTERPVTIERGSNRLVPLESLQYGFEPLIKDVLAVEKDGEDIMNWDGNASKRIVEHLREVFLD